jgi:hypothetical protein
MYIYIHIYIYKYKYTGLFVAAMHLHMKITQTLLKDKPVPQPVPAGVKLKKDRVKYLFNPLEIIELFSTSFLMKSFLSSDELVDLLKKESMMTGMYICVYIFMFITCAYICVF